MNDDTAILSPLPPGQLPDAGDEQERTDGLAEELAKAAPKHWWNRGTVVLAGLVLVAGGFVGGLQAEKHWGTSSSSTSGFPGGFTAGNGTGRYGGGTGRGGGAYGNLGGGFGGTGLGGGAAPGGSTAAPAASGTAGTVKLVDGSTIYVQTAAGDVVTVTTTGKTAVSAAAKSTLKSIKAGQKVTVEGATGSDGTVTATSVIATK